MGGSDRQAEKLNRGADFLIFHRQKRCFLEFSPVGRCLRGLQSEPSELRRSFVISERYSDHIKLGG